MRSFQSLAMGLALATLSCATLPAQADTDTTLEFNRLSRPSDSIGTIGSGMFGDSVDLYSGSGSFDVTDISIPGNSKLPVSLGRHLNITQADLYGGLSSFGNWEIDVPYISGYFDGDGWQVIGDGGQTNSLTGTMQRCSVSTPMGAMPPAVYPTDAKPGAPLSYGYDYWKGNMMYVPGEGMQELLVTNSTSPHPDGNGYHWITKKLWAISCLPTLQSGGSGEGFLATSPDGTKYYFDRMVSKSPQEARALVQYPAFNGVGTVTSYYARTKIWLLASQVVDRFGNTVTYNYNASNRLTSIVGTDRSDANNSRKITLTWNTDGTIHTAYVSPATGTTYTWTYNYSPYTPGPSEDQVPALLSGVTLPDGSSWGYQYSGGLAFVNAVPDTSGDKLQHPSCADPLVPFIRKADASAGNADHLLTDRGYTITATHPSGAQGVFRFSPLVRVRSNIADPSCSGIPAYPKATEQFALNSKVLSGPGLPTYAWIYTYSPIPAGDGGVGLCGGQCPANVFTQVINPDGSGVKSVFGNAKDMNEGQLLETIATATDGNTVLDDQTMSYFGSATGQPFPQHIGQSPQLRANVFLSEEQHPLISRDELRDGVHFYNDVAPASGPNYAFNAYANPTSATKSSVLGSRTEDMTYDDNTALWVLEQPKTLKVNGIDVYAKTYDPATALLQNVYNYDRLDQSYTFTAEGTLATVTNGSSGQTTTLADYHRGVPQSLIFADGTVKTASVDDLGRVTSITDPIGTTPADTSSTTTTSFSYDALGRLKKITQPAGDTIAWQATDIAFVPVGSSEFGLPAGHWKQTETTGNATKITYFDGFWQPVLTQEYDAANPSTTTRFTAKAFDFAGRATFASYPLGSITTFDDSAIAGVHSSYDGLGRPLTSKQDSELGVLTTKYEYLPGFQTRVTNPRGKATITSYQAFDNPDTSHPTQIVSPLGVTTTITRDAFGKPLTMTRSGVGG